MPKGPMVRQGLDGKVTRSRRFNMRLPGDLYVWAVDYVQRLGPEWTVTRLVVDHLRDLKRKDDAARQKEPREEAEVEFKSAKFD